jgi:hydroxymethylpyrimidine pyrophosphatase-like HAD family hydrolase
MYKVVISDLDGTLLNNQQPFSSAPYEYAEKPDAGY